ncbi:DUF4911 domain-containing protein [Haliovirga abyssi]|uniref:DUF4911 domain-containing protein n=1 Tax=Haliovirga abyssi TaxID=2996794 RepID=A0AAU9DPZ7_9FUSO|nr:DUF4911 domain-containing protein [Haliovirga abyssi]BDU50533.1 DUF4911 domain-containing protein [Haliovirga abyssi]
MNSLEFYIKTDKKNIDFINKTIEAYEGMGIVRTLDPKNGLIKIITLDYYEDDIRNILNGLYKYDVELEIIDERNWEGEL